MKNFDISNLVLTSLEDVRRVNLASGTSANRTAANCTIIIKRSGSSLYSFGKKSFVADANNIIFIAKGTEYSLTVEKHGEATVIEFDIAAEQLQNEFQNGAICQYSTLGDKSISKLAKNLCQYYALRGPAYYSKCFSELYSLTTQISTVHAYNRTLAGKYGLIHESVNSFKKITQDRIFTPPCLQNFRESAKRITEIYSKPFSAWRPHITYRSTA